MATPKSILKTRNRLSAKSKASSVVKKAGAVAPHKKKTNPDIVVRRSSYSKAARAAVLANAAARQKLIEMGGENTIDVIREFDCDMSDEELAERTGIKPSEVRVVLNRLHNKGVFAYTRVRDRDSGWYSYIWRMNEAQLRVVGCGGNGGNDVILARSREGYCCPQCSAGGIFDFSDAIGLQFRCRCCGNSLEFVEARKMRK